MFLKCQYNGNDLYSNQWDLCTVEEGTDDRIIYCPVRPGRRKFVKNLKIPNYLPKVTTSYVKILLIEVHPSMLLPCIDFALLAKRTF